MTRSDALAPRLGGRSVRWIAPGLVLGMLLLSACGGAGGIADEVVDRRADPNRGVIPTLPGGIELERLEPGSVLVGSGLAFGAPLPSEQAAADGLADGPEAESALARRIFTLDDGRHVADAIVLSLDGSQLFDHAALAVFASTAVSSLGGGAARAVEIGGRDVVRSSAADGSSAAGGFVEGNLLIIVAASSEEDVTLTLTRQLEARARGEVGTGEPTTPMSPSEPEAAFLAIPTVQFEAFAPPDEETPPAPPSMAGAAATAGRYGIVAGERRTVVWVITPDRGVHRWAESLAPAMEALAAQRADGAAPATHELGGRVVYASANDPGERSAQVFRHRGMVLVVEGNVADQVEAVATAWIAALGPT